MVVTQNKFIKIEHAFIAGKGTFYKTAEIAKAETKKICTGNEVGFYLETIDIDGATWFQSGFSNSWD